MWKIALRRCTALKGLICCAADWEHQGNSLPRYFFGVYYQGNAEQCMRDAPGCVSLCSFRSNP